MFPLRMTLSMARSNQFGLRIRGGPSNAVARSASLQLTEPHFFDGWPQARARWRVQNTGSQPPEAADGGERVAPSDGVEVWARYPVNPEFASLGTVPLGTMVNFVLRPVS